MKVKELISALQDVDGELEVEINLPENARPDCENAWLREVSRAYYDPPSNLSQAAFVIEAGDGIHL
jgi:hypothetical protein